MFDPSMSSPPYSTARGLTSTSLSIPFYNPSKSLNSLTFTQKSPAFPNPVPRTLTITSRVPKVACPVKTRQWPLPWTRFTYLVAFTTLLHSAAAHLPIPAAAAADPRTAITSNNASHTLIFTPYELSTIGAPQRRKTYVSSLEAHIDRIHSRLLQLGSWPVEFSELNPFIGLNSKTAKSMVAGLQHDASVSKLELLELERANADLNKLLPSLHPSPSTQSQGSGS